MSATCPSKIGYPRSSRTCTSRVSSSLFSLTPSLTHSCPFAFSLCTTHESSLVVLAQVPAVDLVAEVVVADVVPHPVVVGGGGDGAGGRGGSRDGGVGHGRSRGRGGGSAVAGRAVDLGRLALATATVVRGLLFLSELKIRLFLSLICFYSASSLILAVFLHGVLFGVLEEI